VTYNHGDEKEVETKKLDEELDEKQDLIDIREILNTPQGQRFFKNMFAFGHIEEQFFKGNSSDAYNLGGRNFALHYWKLCKEADPETFFKLILEIDNG
jgi:hypothetical protein